MSRNARLLGASHRTSRIIEIGPSYAPVAARRDGWNTTVVDHATADELREKYTAIPSVDGTAIEEVDHVWAGGRLENALPTALHGGFDRLIASHVIEHIPDPITFFRSLETVLAPGGTVALAVPDKRFCFDYFKPLTTTADLLYAHDPDGPGRHSKRSLYVHTAYSISADNEVAWSQQPVHAAALLAPLEAAFYAYEQASLDPASPYLDAHAWHFTPSSFRLILLELAEGKLLDWHIDQIFPSEGAEFIVTLRRGRPAWSDPALRDAERLSLLTGTLVEAHEQIAFAIAGGLLDLAPLPAGTARPNSEPGLVGLRALLAAQNAQLAALQSQLAPLATLSRWTLRLLAPLARFRRYLRARHASAATSGPPRTTTPTHPPAPETTP